MGKAAQGISRGLVYLSRHTNVAMKIWYRISEQARQALAKLFLKLAGYPFIPPADNELGISTKFKLENNEEIDRLMRQKPKGRPGRG